MAAAAPSQPVCTHRLEILLWHWLMTSCESFAGNPSCRQRTALEEEPTRTTPGIAWASSQSSLFGGFFSSPCWGDFLLVVGRLKITQQPPVAGPQCFACAGSLNVADMPSGTSPHVCGPSKQHATGDNGAPDAEYAIRKRSLFAVGRVVFVQTPASSIAWRAHLPEANFSPPAK